MSKLSKADIVAIEARMRDLPEPDLTDPDNPEWTAEDFARAEGPESLPADVLVAFPKTRGRPKTDQPKAPVSLRLSADVLEHFKATGKGWQTRINQVLADAIAKGRA